MKSTRARRRKMRRMRQGTRKRRRKVERSIVKKRGRKTRDRTLRRSTVESVRLSSLLQRR